MKLSEAIRKGLVGRQQTVDKLIDKSTGAVCVLGAACLGVGIRPRQTHGSSKLRKIFPELRRLLPEFGETLEAHVTELNDTGTNFINIVRWLRKRGF